MTGLGVLAFGDSITNGGGELQWGVALQSWALWTARGLGLPYSGFAFDGATVDDVLAHEIPLFRRVAEQPGGRYALGCLYIGVNDVRGLEWDADAFAAGHTQALGFLAARCDRTLAVTVPRRLGIPAARADRIELANLAITANARAHRALVLDLRELRARNHVMADRVHPTAFGQVAIAERALSVLAVDGLPAKVRPSELIFPQETTVTGRLRGDITYGYRSAKHWGRAAALQAIGALRATCA